MDPCLQPCILFLFFLLLHSVPQTEGKVNLVVTQSEEVHKVAAGQSVTITCSFTSEYTGYDVKWTFGCDNTVFLHDQPYYQNRINITVPDPVQGKHEHYETQTAITISNLTENDSGIFCCHVKTHGEEGKGNGTRVEVTERRVPPVFPAQDLKRFILYGAVVMETCVILILFAVIIRYHLQGPSGFEDKGNEEPLELESELHYADICNKSHSQLRDRRSENKVTYAPIRNHQ